MTRHGLPLRRSARRHGLPQPRTDDHRRRSRGLRRSDRRLLGAAHERRLRAGTASSGGGSRTACWGSPTRTASCGRAPASCARPRSPFSASATGEFVGPIFIGDTIFVNYRIAELRDSKSKPTQAIATFDVEIVNQDDRVVQRGRKVLLVSKVPLDRGGGVAEDDGRRPMQRRSSPAFRSASAGCRRRSARTPTSRSWP